MSGGVSDALQKIRKVADYQFGRGAGEKLFPANVAITFSKKTGKMRHIYFEGKLLATLKPSTGLFTLSIEGAKRFIDAIQPKKLWVLVQDEASSFVEKGKDVFAKHVSDADEDIRPGEEVVVLNLKNDVIAVGRALLSGREMKSFQRGVAVKVRKGNAEKIKREKM
ncbi:MAG: PUA domain-containing protein [Candidatus Bathyarchaeia archaeon]